MASLDEMLETFGRNAEKFIIPDQETKKAMTKAGAEKLAENLRKEARTKHYQANRKIGKVKHLADSVDIENCDIDEIANGNSIAGFTGKDESGINHARIARFLNDGTVKLQGDHFVDNACRESADDIFTAERKVYESRGVK